MKILYCYLGYAAIEKIAPTVVFVENYIVNAFKKLDLKIEVFPYLGRMSYLDRNYKQKVLEKHPELAGDKRNYFYFIGSIVGEDLMEAAKKYRPDILFLVNGLYMQPQHLNSIRELGAKVVLWSVDDPYEAKLSQSLSEEIDHLFTVDSSMLEQYRQTKRQNVHFLPLGADESIFYPQNSSYVFDLSFIGALFPSRINYIKTLFSESSKYGYSCKVFSHSIVTSNAVPLIDETIRKNVEFRTFPNFLFPDQAALIYNQTKLNINLHRDPPAIKPLSPNERTFNVAACNAFQLIDDTRPDLAKLFEIGKEIVTFHDEKDLAEKASYYIKHEQERKQIAGAAYHRVLAEHTYRHRINKILSMIS